MLAFLLLLGTTLVISISGVVMPGPVFAAAVVSAREDVYSGAKVALGHAVVEFPTIFLVAFGLSALMGGELARIVVGIVGGVMLLAMAYEMFTLDVDDEDMTGGRGRGLVQGRDPLASGVLTTMANPYFFLWWATIGATLVLAALAFGVLGLLVFAIVHWAVDLLWLTFVGYSVNRTRELWRGRGYRLLFAGCAALLVVFGIWFLASAGLLLLG